MTDHFGGVGGGASGGGLTEDQVTALIQGASVNNVTNSQVSDPLNSYAVPTFVDASGRGVKRSRIYQDDTYNAGRVTFNQPAESVQLPGTRGAPGYALTMHRDPVLAAQGRTEWYSESVVVPDVLQVSSISSLNPGVIPLDIKTAVSFTGGQVVDYATSDCTNISTLDAVDLKATNSLETTLVKNDVGDLDVQALNDFLRLEGDVTNITSTQSTTVTSAGGVTVFKGSSRLQIFGNENIDLVSGNGNIDVDSVSGTVEVRASNDKLTLAGNTLDLSVVVGVAENKVLEIKNTGAAVFNGSVLCKNNAVGIQGATAGVDTSLNFTDAFAFARGNITASDTTVVLEAKDSRRLKLIGAGSDYLIIDPNNVTTPFDVTIGLPSTQNTVRGSLTVSENLTVSGNEEVTGQIKQFGAIVSGGVPVLASYFRRTSEFVLANTAVETNILDPLEGVGVVAIPAGVFQVGSSFQFTAAGVASTDGKNSDITYRVKFNGSTLVSTGSVRITGDARYHEVDVIFTVRSIGAAGSVCVLGCIKNGDQVLPLTYVASTTLNTTITNTLSVTAQWDSADAGDELKLGVVNLRSI
jgi:hypothetical protein